MVPVTSDRNFTPSSTALESPLSTCDGIVVAPQMLHGQDPGGGGAAAVVNDQVKFATYTRDAATGLDYADQRYYANNLGRFMMADPYRASGVWGIRGVGIGMPMFRVILSIFRIRKASLQDPSNTLPLPSLRPNGDLRRSAILA